MAWNNTDQMRLNEESNRGPAVWKDRQVGDWTLRLRRIATTSRARYSRQRKRGEVPGTNTQIEQTHKFHQMSTMTIIAML